MTNAEMTIKAVAINEELTTIETTAKSVRDREAAVLDLVQRYPKTAVAAIADIRGFGNLARIARQS